MVEGHYPGSVQEALFCRSQFPNALLICGGTDVMVARRQAEHIIFLNQIPEMQRISQSEDILSIGSGVTYHALLQDGRIPDVLKKSIANIASPAIRNAGTMTGNICNASPAGDTLPVLYALDAVVVKASAEAGNPEKIIETRMPVAEFILGIRKIALEENEIVTAVEVPVSSYAMAAKAVFEKVGARQSEAISKASFCGVLHIQNGIITNAAIAFGSVAITVVRDREAEQKLIGLSLQQIRIEEKMQEILAEYSEKIHPIDDQRSTASYRKWVCLNLLRDFMEG